MKDKEKNLVTRNLIAWTTDPNFCFILVWLQIDESRVLVNTKLKIEENQVVVLTKGCLWLSVQQDGDQLRKMAAE